MLFVQRTRIGVGLARKEKGAGWKPAPFLPNMLPGESLRGV